MSDIKEKRLQALKALKQVIPLFTTYNFKWVITGGFACYVYGVDRDITDIDIDICASKDDPEFKSLIQALAPNITQPLMHYVDQNLDNYNFEATIDGVIVDICPMAELKMFNKATKSYELCYPSGFPDTEVRSFEGVDLLLLSKQWIIKDKEQLVWQRESDIRDIEGLKNLQIGDIKDNIQGHNLN